VKVIQIIARMNVGGPALQMVEGGLALSEAGHEGLIVAGEPGIWEGDSTHLALAAGLRVERVPSMGREVAPHRDLAALASLTALLRRERPDLVHTHTAKAGSLGRVAARMAGVPALVHTFHGHVLHGYFGRVGSAAALAVERFLGRRTDAIVVEGETQRTEILGLGIGSPETVRSIPIGVPLGPYRDRAGEPGWLRAELGCDGSTPLVGAVMRLAPVKAPWDLLEAFRIARGSHPEARLAILGVGPLGSPFRRRLETLGLSDAVRLLGYRPDLAGFYRDLDLLALSSWSEGMPTCLVEAQAAGVAVCATRVGAVAEVVGAVPGDGTPPSPSGDGPSALLVPPRDPAALGRAMSELLADPGRRRALGEAGRKQAERFDARLLRERILDLYESLAGGAVTRPDSGGTGESA
jgi:glycosyltransferase involved in cell wall biosynthesis